MDTATNIDGLNEMYCICIHIFVTHNYGSKFQPHFQKGNGNWIMKLYTDSDWTDKITHHSTTGLVIYVHNVPIVWKSQTLKAVASTSTEAEYYAAADATNEIVQVMESMGIEVENPIVVHIDNFSATKHTLHIDARYHFIREYILDGMIKLIFVQSAKNMADIFTKNITSETFVEHIGDFIIEQEVVCLTKKEIDEWNNLHSGRRVLK
jgi:hypothetical protein